MTEDEDLMASLERLGESALRIKAERDELLECLKGAMIWFDVLCREDGADIDPEETAFTARVIGADGLPTGKTVSVTLAEGLAKYRAAIAKATGQ